MKRNIGTIDLDTGELLDGTPVWVGVKNNPYGRFFMANQDALVEIAKDKDLTLEPKNVLLYLFGKLDFENYIQVPQVEISKALNMDKSKVSKSIKLLISKEILLRGPKITRSSSFRLNPNYGWKGSAKNHKEALKQRMKKQGLSVIEGS